VSSRLGGISRILLALGMTFLVFAAQGRDALPMAEDETVEKRMVAISDELRCLVCQNESLSGSHAELANDLRREIRSLIKDGKSDAEIMDFMVSRYGDFVRYRPPLKATTYLLWFGPFLLLAGAIVALVVYLRRRGRRVAAAAENADGGLSADELRQAEALLKQTETIESENKR